MKKLAVFVLTLSMLLCACGGPAPEKAESFACGTGERQCYAISGDTLISAAVNCVRGFDLTGEKIFDIQSAIAHPAVCSNGSDAVICDVGGSAIVYGDGSRLDFKNTIISASLSDGGFLAVCAEEPGYKGAVTVYSPEKKPRVQVVFRRAADSLCGGIAGRRAPCRAVFGRKRRRDTYIYL